MAKKFRISQDPTFKTTVDIPRIGGQVDKVEFEFKYLPRTELAKMYDGWGEAIQQMSDKMIEESGDMLSLEDMNSKEMELHQAQLKDIIAGWGFEEPFNDDNLSLLVNGSLKAVRAITEAYQKAYHLETVGN